MKKGNILFVGSPSAKLAVRDKVSLDEAYATATCFVPLKRPGSLKEIGRAVQFLTSEESTYITGAELVVDGGLTIVDPGMVGFM